MLLKGLRILAVEQYGAGPFGTQFMSDLGAEVIKIENPNDGGDMSRSVGPYFRDELPPTAKSVFYQGLNRGKKSVVIDLASESGQRDLHALAASAHGLITNLRPSAIRKLGLTYEALKAANPKIEIGRAHV